WRRWRKRSAGDGRRSSTAIKGRSSPVRSSPASWKDGASPSAWTGAGDAWTTFFIERLWRSLKYEEVYLRDYRMVPEARRASTATSSSTITSGRIRAWRIGRRRTSTRVEVCGHDTEVNSEGGRCCYWGLCPKPPEFSAFRPELAVFGSTITEALERRIGLRRNAT